MPSDGCEIERRRNERRVSSSAWSSLGLRTMHTRYGTASASDQWVISRDATDDMLPDSSMLAAFDGFDAVTRPLCAIPSYTASCVPRQPRYAARCAIDGFPCYRGDPTPFTLSAQRSLARREAAFCLVDH